MARSDFRFDENHKAFSGMFDEYWKKVLRFARLYIADQYEQEEVVQEAFIKLWEMRESIEPDSNIDGLLFIITRNLIFNRHRHTLHESELMDDLARVVDRECDIEGQIDADNLREYIEKLISVLPPRQREAFMMSRYDQLNVKEIAARMNISERGVERNIYLALKFIRRHLPLFMVFMACIEHAEA